MSEGLLNALMITEVVIVGILVVIILLQPGDEGMGSMFGGGGGESFRTKRGLERMLYYVTISLAVLFSALSFIIVKFAG